MRLIVLVEARAAPRLHTVEGFWRKTTKASPGRMTDFIRHKRLLPVDEIDRIERDPADASVSRRVMTIMVREDM